MLREVLLGLSENLAVKKLITRFPPTRRMVQTYVAGEGLAEAVTATRRITDDGLLVSIDHLGEDTSTPDQADAVAHAYLDLIDQLFRNKLAGRAEVSIKLSAIGHDHDQALDNARVVCIAARQAGTTVTVDMEDHTTTDSTLAAVADLRTDHPDTGVVLQSSLKRTESDCRELATAGSRVRLCKGAYSAPESVAYPDRRGIDKSYVRCLRTLINGPGYPMVATHDPRLIAIAEDLVRRADRDPDSYEFQMLYGIGRPEQRRLLGDGHRVRIYLPYGTDWYGYLIRRLAERPANLMLLARSLLRR